MTRPSAPGTTSPAAGPPEQMTPEDPTLLDTIKRYIGFGEADADRLRSLLPALRPEFPQIVEHFYDLVQEFPDAAAVITGGDAQLARLRRTLVDWLETAFAGPHDAAYHGRRLRIGWVHVRIGLPQHYMVTGMNVIRSELHRRLDAMDLGPEAAASRSAVDRLLDLELAIMLDAYRTASDDRLRRRERLATVGQLAATIAHDLRNPLSVAKSSVYILKRRAGDDERVHRHLTRIEEQLEVGNEIISTLLELAREREIRHEPVGVAMLVRDALLAVESPADVAHHVSVPDDLFVSGERPLLRQALVNLLINAHQALEGRGNLWVEARPADKDRVELVLADDGPGFPPEVLAAVFEPLVTTRAQGTGLGLALVKNIVARHGGEVDASNVERGARIRLWLPRANPPSSA